MEGRARSEPLDDLPGTLILFMGVGPDEIEIHLVGLGLGEKFAAAGEGCQLLTRLDLAIAKAYNEEIFTDEINPPPTNSKRS